jgi:hypothetical protein
VSKDPGPRNRHQEAEKLEIGALSVDALFRGIYGREQDVDPSLPELGEIGADAERIEGAARPEAFRECALKER